MIDTNQSLTKTNLTVLTFIAIFFVYDLFDDVVAGDDWGHFAIEFIVFLIILIVLAKNFIHSQSLKQKLSESETQLSELQGDFADKIRAQFEHWKLSPSEVEVAWLIIKGFSFIEIGHLRNVREKTVRQQAVTIYSKSNTSNRNDFAAVFIDDLLNANTR